MNRLFSMEPNNHNDSGILNTVSCLKRMIPRFILRKESFGGLLYDRHHTITRAVRKSEFDSLLDRNKDMDIVIRENKESISLSAPLRVHLVLTRRCNLSCIHCLNESGTNHDEEFTYPEILRFLSELRQMGVFELAITGGEPLCHVDLFRIIKLANSEGFVLHLNTNGICSDAKLEALSQASLSKIKISLDGLKETNDNIRGKGTFRKAIQSIQYLRSKQQDIRVNFTLMQSNKQDLVGMIQLANKLECDLKINPFIPVGRGKRLKEQAFTIDEGNELARYISDYCHRNSITIRVQIMSTFVSHSCKDTWENFNYQFTDCGIRLTQFIIDSDGKAYAMGRLTDLQKEKALGNAHEESIAELWEKAKIRNVRELCHECSSMDVITLLFDSFNLMSPF